MLSDEAGEQLRAWIEARTELPTVWGDQPERYQPGDYIVLGIGAIRRIGQDGLRWVHDPDLPAGSDMVPTVVGQREFTLSVQVRAWSQELSQTAEAALWPLQAALSLPSFAALMLELNLGIIDSGDIQQADVIVDDRVQSRASVDIRFATSIQVQDVDEAESYIATAEIETTLQGDVYYGDIVLNDTVGDV